MKTRTTIGAVLAALLCIGGAYAQEKADASHFLKYLPQETRAFFHVDVAGFKSAVEFPKSMRKSFEGESRYLPRALKGNIATVTKVEIDSRVVSSLLPVVLSPSGMKKKSSDKEFRDGPTKTPSKKKGEDFEKKKPETKEPQQKNDCGEQKEGGFGDQGHIAYLPSPIIIVRTIQPYDKQSVLKTLPYLPSFDFKDENQNQKKKISVKFLDKRTIAFARDSKLVESVKGNATSPFAKQIDGHKKQLMIVGIHVTEADAAKNRKMIAEFSDRFRSFDAVHHLAQPILAMKGGTGVASAGETLRLTGGFAFANAKAAKRAAQSCRDGFVLFRIFILQRELARMSSSLGRVAAREGVDAALFQMRFMQQLSKAMQNVQVHTKKNSIVLLGHEANGLFRIADQVTKLRKKLDSDPNLVAARQLAVKREQSLNNLRQIGIAMHSFHDVNKYLPPPAILDRKTGKPLLSWRVLILPYVEEFELYKKFRLNESWDSPHNKKLLRFMPKVYAPVVETKKKYHTFYRVFAGKNTAFPILPDGNRSYGARGISLAHFLDGTSNTWMVVEAGEAVPWTKPEPLVYDPEKPLPKLGGMFKDGFHVGMADGSARGVTRAIPEKIMRLWITADDGQPVDYDAYRWPMIKLPPLPDFDE